MSGQREETYPLKVDINNSGSFENGDYSGKEPKRTTSIVNIIKDNGIAIGLSAVVLVSLVISSVALCKINNFNLDQGATSNPEELRSLQDQVNNLISSLQDKDYKITRLESQIKDFDDKFSDYKSEIERKFSYQINNLSNIVNRISEIEGNIKDHQISIQKNINDINSISKNTTSQITAAEQKFNQDLFTAKREIYGRQDKINSDQNSKLSNIEQDVTSRFQNLMSSLNDVNTRSDKMESAISDLKYDNTKEFSSKIGGVYSEIKSLKINTRDIKKEEQYFADESSKILNLIAKKLLNQNPDELAVLNIRMSQNEINELKDNIDFVETCRYPSYIPNINGFIECSSSPVSGDSKSGCENAIDGVLKSRTSASEWTTRGDVNPWIRLKFRNQIRVKEIKLLQKYDDRYAATKVNVTLNGIGNMQTQLTALGSNNWNVIKLPGKSHSTDEIKIEIVETKNQQWGPTGFKEIKLVGCTEN